MGLFSRNKPSYRRIFEHELRSGLTAYNKSTGKRVRIDSVMNGNVKYSNEKGVFSTPVSIFLSTFGKL